MRGPTIEMEDFTDRPQAFEISDGCSDSALTDRRQIPASLWVYAHLIDAQCVRFAQQFVVITWPTSPVANRQQRSLPSVRMRSMTFRSRHPLKRCRLSDLIS